MGFKSNPKNLTFSDFENSSTKKKNRSLETLMNMDNTIAWNKIESILLSDYPVGNKKEKNKVYSPLLLFKCLFIQKWFIMRKWIVNNIKPVAKLKKILKACVHSQ